MSRGLGVSIPATMGRLWARPSCLAVGAATAATTTNSRTQSLDEVSGLGSRNGNGGSSLPLPPVLLLPPSQFPLYSSLVPCNGVIRELDPNIVASEPPST